MAGTSSGSRPFFPWISAFTSPTPGPPGASSADRKAEVSEEKPWLNAQEPLLSPWSGNLYRQGVRDPGEGKRKVKKVKWQGPPGITVVGRVRKQCCHGAPFISTALNSVDMPLGEGLSH